MSWFRKKKKETGEVRAVVGGTYVEQEKLPDPVFSQGMMGPAFGIAPTSGNVTAPFDGTVSMMFPTGHALGLTRSDGLEQLVHIGVDTVNLNGEGFQAQVKEGQPVKQGDLLVKFDPALVRSRNLSPVVICAFTSELSSCSPCVHGKQVRAGDVLFEASAAE